MLDHDLALLYGVTTGALVQAVKRNAERFPADFTFQPSEGEFAILKSQIVISSWGGRRAARIYGTRRCHSVRRIARHWCGRRECRDHANLRPAASPATLPGSNGTKAHRVGAAIRQPVQDRVRRDTADHGTRSSTKTTPDPIPPRRVITRLSENSSSNPPRRFRGVGSRRLSA